MNLDKFLTDYFTAHQCAVTDDGRGVIHVELTEKLDRILMNRPFYWQYIKSTGSKGQPMNLTFIVNPERREEKGEWIHYGSPRLLQIFRHLKENEKFTRQFQIIDTHTNTPLYPWLLINMKISYQGKHTKDEIFSIGLHLVNGMMKTNMMEEIKNIPFSRKISDYCYPISPMIQLRSGFSRIEKLLERYIQDLDHKWAEQSVEMMEEEKALLRHFFDSNAEENMEKEIKEIEMRYRPKVIMNVINGGIIYLKADSI